MADDPKNFVTDETAPVSVAADTSVFSMFSLKGRLAIVTGAGAGIGLSVAEALAEAGADVAIWFNSNKAAVERAAEIEAKYGVKCRAFQVGVTDYDEVVRGVQAVESQMGGTVSVFVANAGIPWKEGSILDGTLESYHRVMKTDVDSIMYCARAIGESFQRYHATSSRTASFIATASMSGHIANLPQLQTPYNAAKAAVIHFCKCLALDFLPFARANSVSPGYIKTEISDFIPKATKEIWKDKIPMRREGEPQELKGVYLYLASDASSYQTGTDVLVDGGYCAP